MKDDFDELERGISRLPMPSVSQSLDDRVSASLQHIRHSNRSSALKTTRVAQSASTWWRGAALQALAAIILCVVSFAAGRYSGSLGKSQADHPQSRLDHRQIAVVEALIEPSAKSSFQRLVGENFAQENIWGNTIDVDDSVKEEL